MAKFVDRERELAALERACSPGLAVVSGRRRVGKTALLDRFASDRVGGVPAGDASPGGRGPAPPRGAAARGAAARARATCSTWATCRPGTPRWATCSRGRARSRCWSCSTSSPTSARPTPPCPRRCRHAGTTAATASCRWCSAGSHVGLMEQLVAADAPLFGRADAHLRVSPFGWREAALLGGRRPRQRARGVLHGRRDAPLPRALGPPAGRGDQPRRAAGRPGRAARRRGHRRAAGAERVLGRRPGAGAGRPGRGHVRRRAGAGGAGAGDHQRGARRRWRAWGCSPARPPWTPTRDAPDASATCCATRSCGCGWRWCSPTARPSSSAAASRSWPRPPSASPPASRRRSRGVARDWLAERTGLPSGAWWDRAGRAASTSWRWTAPAPSRLPRHTGRGGIDGAAIAERVRAALASGGLPPPDEVAVLARSGTAVVTPADLLGDH